MVYIINKTSNRTRNLSKDDKKKRKKEFFAKARKKKIKREGDRTEIDWENFEKNTEKKWQKESPYN